MSNDTKLCCTCETAKPMGDFNRYSASKDGRQPRCRECQRLKRVGWYQANREREIAKTKAWRTANPDKVKSVEAARVRDPEKLKAISAAYRERLGDELLARKAADRSANLLRYRESERLWRAKNAESIASRKREYRQTNPNISLSERANAHRRRAKTVGGPTGREIKDKMDYYGNVCWICGDKGASIDHVKPLDKGGFHLLANLRPACSPCNSRKRARWYGVDRIDELKAWVLLRLAS